MKATKPFEPVKKPKKGEDTTAILLSNLLLGAVLFGYVFMLFASLFR